MTAELCARCGLPLTAHPSECPWNPPRLWWIHEPITFRPITQEN